MPISEDYQEAEPANLSKVSVEAVAERVASKLGYTAGADLEPVLQKMGGRIELQSFWEFDQSSSGSIRIEKKGDFTIYLGMHTSSDRDRFTIAHELGHYVLHYLYRQLQDKDLGRLKAARYGGGRVEAEANWFAAAFLMPESQFRLKYVEVGGDSYAIASHFRVSVSAAKVRAQSLDLE